MSQKELEYLANEICVLRRTLTDLENKVNRCMWGPAQEPCYDDWGTPLRVQDTSLEKCLREHLENEIKEVEEREAKEGCQFGSKSPMVSYWVGMKVGYTNIRCWLDQRG
jgi:hypothetical protein